MKNIIIKILCTFLCIIVLTSLAIALHKLSLYFAVPTLNYRDVTEYEIPMIISFPFAIIWGGSAISLSYIVAQIFDKFPTR